MTENNGIDLTSELYLDTYLSVKFSNGKFVHYVVPINRKDGTKRQYGDLFKYFTQKDGFRFAKGYILEQDSSFWIGQRQYFYFDKKGLEMSVKILPSPLFLAK